jgi:hypothetical protein
MGHRKISYLLYTIELQFVTLLCQCRQHSVSLSLTEQQNDQFALATVRINFVSSKKYSRQIRNSKKEIENKYVIFKTNMKKTYI